jgi:opacity protein-like surface antigen
VTRIILLLAGLAVATPAAAQNPPVVSIRPFVMATAQSFAASDTFDASFGKTVLPFFGAGVQVVVNDGFFVELGVSRFRQTGERAFLSNGTPFKLGIPLTATITPLEITGGYRFKPRQYPRVRPYVAAGFGTYAYQETSSFADAGEDVDTTHAGFVMNGGAEFRVHRSVGLALDVQYSHVPGILGTGGLSQQAGESDLGGVAARMKLVVGR